jgi:dTDP-4-dehydrorhamnose 3,5-epimerase-like enzyme
MNKTIADCKIITIPKIVDTRGNLAVIEKDFLPFDLSRIYYLYNVPAGAYRGGHAHKKQSEFLIAISGSFEVIINDGFTTKTLILKRPDEGLLLPPGIWRELKDFSQGSVCLVVNSGEFSEEDYIRDFGHFIKVKNSIF